MQVVITGGAGFLGVRLARTLLEKGHLSLAGAAPSASGNSSGILCLLRVIVGDGVFYSKRLGARLFQTR